MKIKPVIWNHQKQKNDKRGLKDGTFPVKIRATTTEGGRTKVRYFPLQFYIKPEEWDAKSCRVKPSRSNSSEINLKISEKMVEIERNFIHHEEAEPGNRTDFYYWLDLRISGLQKRINPKTGEGENYYGNFISLKNTLKTYSNSLTVRSVTVEWLKNYEAHLRFKGRKQTTIYELMNKIHSVILLAIQGGAIPMTKDPFLRFGVPKGESEKISLTEDQIDILAKFKGSKPLEKAVKFYLVSYYEGGMRGGDVCRLKWSMINDGGLSYKMHKTKINFQIPVTKQALEVLNSIDRTSEYIFDFEIDWKNQDWAIRVVLSAVRRNLKRACRLMGLPEITPHTTRNSLGSKAHKEGVSTKDMQGVFGHKSETTTQIYQKRFDMGRTVETFKRLYGE